MVGVSERDAYWHFQAQEMHSLCVLDSIRDLQLEIIDLSNKVENEDAINNLNFGAARRSRMIWGAFRQLHNLIAPDRSVPMEHDDVFEASRALNDIYIHVRGTLDNYAWALFHLFWDNSLAINRSEIDLFGRRFRSIIAFSDFNEILSSYLPWNRELKERRDPVAHRIPLSVPPSFFNEADQLRFSEVNQKFDAARRRHLELTSNGAAQSELDAASNEADAHYAQLQKIGTFAPIIVHDPKEGGTRIYPTVPQDIGTLVRIIRGLSTAISRRLDGDQ